MFSQPAEQLRRLVEAMLEQLDAQLLILGEHQSSAEDMLKYAQVL
jgi:hypothetical protein